MTSGDPEFMPPAPDAIGQQVYYKHALSIFLHMEGKDNFLRVYANVPISLRKDIIFVDQDEDDEGEPPYGPVTWQAAYLEIMKESELGGKILDRLTRMGII